VGWEVGLLISLFLFIFLGIPLLIIVGGGLYLILDWIRPTGDPSKLLTQDDENEAMARDLARTDARRGKRRKRGTR
jgi:hypothetical protein